ncbi:serine/threonine protein kinase [Frankia sp. AiPs1]|uniref:WD40 repeat domain-containing serine/threonine protein kinase n=1 Tax=Frankia sp. AiPs1 TaxID=573493 RepID=UPI0020443DA3|nr:serine/threonine-protein kinase [Frankia sp. AiPs1]MCM3920208.1 serine/threonine protein kinase [Frankia sp. AiPs1]
MTARGQREISGWLAGAAASSARVIVDRGRIAAALPGYKLGAQLGVGGFGLVVAGRHRRLRRQVAIKVVPSEADDASAFVAEARLLAGLDHPHIVRVYDYLESDGLGFIVMELLDGGTLTRRQQAGISPPQACAVGLAVAAALAYVHERGVLHRDIKAANVLFDSAGLAKVTDFGIARLFAGSGVTGTARGAGTPAYMAPEQIRGGRLGPTADLYALGTLLYQMLTGATPFDPSLPLPQLWAQHLSVAPAPPIGTPAPLADVILRALAKDPTDRQPDADAFARDLAAAAVDVYGPRWLVSTGLSLHLGEEIRRIAAPTLAELSPSVLSVAVRSDCLGETSSWQSTHAADHESVSSPPRPTPHHDLRTVDRSTSIGAGSIPAQRHRGRHVPRPPARRRARQLQILVPITLVLVAAIAAVLLTTRAPGPPAAGTGPRTTASSAAPGSTPAAFRGLTLSGFSDAVSSVAFSPDGHTLAGGSWDTTVRLWDVTHRDQPAPIGKPLTGHSLYVTSVTFSPDGRTLAVGGWDKTVQLWDMNNRNHPELLGHPLTGAAGQVNSVAFSPDGRTLAVGGWGRMIQLWDLADRTHPLPLGQLLVAGGVASVGFSPDGRTLAGGGADGVLRLWDLTDRTRPTVLGRPLTAEFKALTALAFSPDGHTLATAGFDDIAHLWDLTDRTRPTDLGKMPTSKGESSATITFSPNGRTLASTERWGTVQLADAVSRAVSAPLRGHSDTVNSVAFSPDGRTLASGSGDRTIRLWDVTDPARPAAIG